MYGIPITDSTLTFAIGILSILFSSGSSNMTKCFFVSVTCQVIHTCSVILQVSKENLFFKCSNLHPSYISSTTLSLLKEYLKYSANIFSKVQSRFREWIKVSSTSKMKHFKFWNLLWNDWVFLLQIVCKFVLVFKYSY